MPANAGEFDYRAEVEVTAGSCRPSSGWGGGAAVSGLARGFEIVKNTGHMKIVERYAHTGELANVFKNPAIRSVSSFCRLRRCRGRSSEPSLPSAGLNQTINHTFQGGAFLGTTARWLGMAGVKARVVMTRYYYLCVEHSATDAAAGC